MATRKKFGTLLDERLVRRAKERAAQEGKAFSGSSIAVRDSDAPARRRWHAARREQSRAHGSVCHRRAPLGIPSK
jgi:hypothetical protein